MLERIWCTWYAGVFIRIFGKLFRWKPFQRSAYLRNKEEMATHKSSSKRDDPRNKKFFGSLIKPKVGCNVSLRLSVSSAELTSLACMLSNSSFLKFKNHLLHASTISMDEA